MSKPSDLVQGTLDLLLLKILALQPLHGWAISRRLTTLSGDVLQVSEGSLYPALHKLEQEGWIKAEWKQTGEQPARQVLCAHAPGTEAARGGDGELEAAVVRDHARGATLGGVSGACEPSTGGHGAATQVDVPRSRADPEIDQEMRVPPREEDRGRHRQGPPRKRRETPRRSARWVGWSRARRRCATRDASAG